MNDYNKTMSRLCDIGKNDKKNTPLCLFNDSRFFFSDTRNFQEKELVVVGAGSVKLPLKHVLERNAFPYWGIEVITEGRASLKSEAGNFILERGGIFAYPPNFSFKLESLGETNLKKYFVTFAGAHASKILKDAGLEICMPLKTFQVSYLYGLIEQLLDCAYLPEAHKHEISKDLMNVLVKMINIASHEKVQYLENSYGTYLKCKNFIQENYMSLKKISEVAEFCHIDKAYLSRLFKKYEKLSPNEFLRNLKMVTAANMLLSQSFNMKTISERLEFCDVFHFSKTFKKHFGVSPKNYLEKEAADSLRERK
jgi:AraC-type DNA-binding domain-containing proteins